MALAALALGLVFLLLYGIGLGLIDRELQQSKTSLALLQQFYDFIVVAGMYVVHFLTIMLAIFASVDTVAGEITSHTIQTLVTKPVRRWQIIMGKWIGYALMLIGYLCLLGGGMLLITYMLVDYIPPDPLEGVLLLILEALVLLSLSLLGGTRLSTLTNGVVLFMLYGLAFIGAWVEQIGSLLQSGAAIDVGIVTGLIMPVETLWRRAAFVMQSPLSQSIPSPFSSPSIPSPAMTIYALIYMTVVLLLALRSFQTRDL